MKSKKLCITILLISSYAAGQTFEELFSKANSLHYQQKFDEAISYYKKALEVNPASAQTHFNLGLTFSYIKKPKQAINHFEHALEIDPNYSKAYTFLADAYSQLKDYEHAIACFKKALEKQPDNTILLAKLGVCYVTIDDLESAYQTYKRAQEIDPNNMGVLYNCAFVLNRLNRHAEAIGYYKKVIEHWPEEGRTYLGLSNALLATGNFDEGWRKFEYRFADPKKYQAAFKHHLRTPKDFAGKRVIIRAEFGLGDTVQFVRYAKLLKQCGATVFLQTFAPLVKLLSACDFIDTVFSTSDPYPPDFDMHVPLLSLPMIFNTTLETIPADVPYIKADETLVKRWKATLDSSSNFKIGICWRAKPIPMEDHLYTRRSIPLSTFIPLAELEGVSLYSLQKVYGTDELNSLPDHVQIHEFGSDFDETHGRFMDTTAVIKNLDLIVTADTSIVHVAGALGAQVWVLLPYTAEWRWMHTRTDTPWYPNNMRLFRQSKPGDWHSVMDKVIIELQKLIDRKNFHAQQP